MIRKISFDRRQVQGDTAMGNINNFFQKLIGVTTCKYSGDVVLVMK